MKHLKNVHEHLNIISVVSKKIILTMLVTVSVIACKVDSKNKVETSDAKEVKQISYTKDIFEVEKSQLTWKGFKPTGSHHGVVKIIKGKLILSGNALIGGKFQIDMNSITDLDMPADDAYNKKLVDHLKSEDFFSVSEYPKAFFEITQVTNDGDKIRVSGNLRIKGIIKNITIPAATVTRVNDVVTFKSEPFKIDRTEFGIQYKSTKLADIIKEKSIDDLFEMSFDILAKKQ